MQGQEQVQQPIETHASMPTARSWRPVPLLVGGVVLHAALLLLVLWRPTLWLWCLLAVALNHALIVALVFVPRSSWLGKAVTRLPASAVTQGWVALTFDDGPDPVVTPQVLDVCWIVTRPKPVSSVSSTAVR